MTRVGILGGGNISEAHARAAREIEGVRVVAVHGQNRAKAERLAQTYGGALMNQGVHTLDLLWLLGDVKNVYAKTVTALHDIEVEDTVVATLEFENGASARSKRRPPRTPATRAASS